jgi:hypothetical protein
MMMRHVARIGPGLVQVKYRIRRMMYALVLALLLSLACSNDTPAEAARAPLLFHAPLPVRVVLIGFEASSTSDPALDPDALRALLFRALPHHTPSLIGDSTGIDDGTVAHAAAAARVAAARPSPLEFVLNYTVVALGAEALRAYDDLLSDALLPAPGESALADVAALDDIEVHGYSAFTPYTGFTP